MLLDINLLFEVYKNFYLLQTLVLVSQSRFVLSVRTAITAPAHPWSRGPQYFSDF